MNRISLEAYRNQLRELQNSTARILSQLERDIDITEPETNNAAARSLSSGFDSKQLLIASGFFNSEEAEGNQAKGLYTFISYYSNQMTEEQFKGIVKRVLEFQAKGKVREKVPYLKNSIKNFVKARGGFVL